MFLNQYEPFDDSEADEVVPDLGVALIWKVPVDIEAMVVETRAVISMGWYLIMGIEIGTGEGEARRGGGVGAGVLDGTGTGIGIVYPHHHLSRIISNRRRTCRPIYNSR